MSEPDLMVSDAERDQAVERLRAAAGEGRLATDELEQRISDALGARTRGDLRALLADLPPAALPATAAGMTVSMPEAHERSLMLRRQIAGFVSPNLVVLSVWAATGARGGFWPGWVLLGTGIFFGQFLVRFALGIEHESDHHPRGHHDHDHHRRHR
jgi:hypothetical protein